MPNYKDETGNKYGKLTVLYKVNNPKKDGAMWHCQCECGNYRDVLGKRLRSGEITQCKECKSAILRKNRTGEKYGKLTVLNEYKSYNGIIYWKCKCDCGKETWVRSGNLTSGQVKSCGCMPQDLTPKYDLVNKRFGNLTVIKLSRRKNGHLYWLCKCDCGNLKEVKTVDLTHNKVKSCGCLKITPGEQKIIQLLQKNNLSFNYEHKFEDLKNNTSGHYYRFDFYVDDKYCIEFDGRQHWGGAGWKDYSLEQLEKNDKIKNEYCKTHNIPLIRIPYWHYDDITIEDLIPETSQFLV